MYRIDTLLKQDQRLFHTQDLSLLWGLENKNTLYTVIKRYIQKGILIPIHKGFYATAPLEKINDIRLGIGFIHSYGYLSTESVLVQNGIIFQQSSYLTIVSKISKRFAIGKINYLVRKMQSRYLYNPAGILEKNGLFIATVERAVADILYFNPYYNFDARDKINWNKVKQIQKEVEYK